MQDYITRLEQRLRQPLPGLNAQMLMSPPIRGREVVIPPDVRRGGVLACLHPHRHELHLTLMKRVEDGTTHSGQISFPGGKVEPDDPSLLHTALREAEEEVGIPQAQVQILGKLTELYIPPSNFLVYPTVGFLPSRPNFVIDPREVAQVLEVPLSYLLRGDLASTRKVQMSGNRNLFLDVPTYDLYGHIVWGATAMMLCELITLLRDIEQ